MTTTRKPLSDATWANLNGIYLNRHLMEQRLWGWPAQADLAHELHERLPSLGLGSCRTLVEATGNSLPVLVTLLDGRREVGVVREFFASPLSSLGLQVWGFTLRLPMHTVAQVKAVTPGLLAPVDRVAPEPCSTCQRPTEIIDGQRRHSAWSGDHLPPNYDPDEREADPIDLQDEARGDFTPGVW